MIKNIEDLKVKDEVMAMQEGTEAVEPNEVKTNVFTKIGNWFKENRKTIVISTVTGIAGAAIGFGKGKEVGIAVGKAIAEAAKNSDEIVDNVVEFVQNVEVENF